MQRLVPGCVFTRRDIAALFGGNARAFLPRLKTGEVVAGCFDPVKNPRAPHEALVHSTGNAEINAKRFLEQSISRPRSMAAAFGSDHDRHSAGSPPVVGSLDAAMGGRGGESSGVPIFLRLAPNVWEYVGHFRAVRYSTDPDEVSMRIYEIHPRIYERHAREYGQMKGILFLEEV